MENLEFVLAHAGDAVAKTSTICDQATRREFMDTPYAYWVWLEQEDGTYTRGIPSKVPYMVTRNPYKVTVAQKLYWNHYELPSTVPVCALSPHKEKV